MATIKERAKDAVHKQYDCDCPCYGIDVCKFGNGDENAYSCGDCGANEFNQGYLKGATEQREIDIEKACSWLEMAILSGMIDVYGCNAKEAVEIFRKMMINED